MSFSIIYHPDVKKRDIPAINSNVHQRLKQAIKTRLMVKNPIAQSSIPMLVQFF